MSLAAFGTPVGPNTKAAIALTARPGGGAARRIRPTYEDDGRRPHTGCGHVARPGTLAAADRADHRVAPLLTTMSTQRRRVTHGGRDRTAADCGCVGRC